MTSDKNHFCAIKCTTHMYTNPLICCDILVSKHPAHQIAFLDAEVIITYCSPASCMVHFNAALMCTSPVNESEHWVICPTYQAHILTVSTIMRPPTTMCAVCQCAGICWAAEIIQPYGISALSESGTGSQGYNTAEEENAAPQLNIKAAFRGMGTPIKNRRSSVYMGIYILGQDRIFALRRSPKRSI